MSSNTGNQILQTLQWRYATKLFNPDLKIQDKDWNVLEQSLVQAPSSYGLQPWKFLVVQNKNLRKDLRKVTWDQSQVTDCSHYVVFLSKTQLDEDHINKHLARISAVRQVPLESLSAYKNMMFNNLLKSERTKTLRFWAQRQAYIAMGFLLETAGLLQIDACPIEGLEPLEYDKILSLNSTGWETVAAVALGYRSTQDKYQTLAKVRFAKENVIQYLND